MFAIIAMTTFILIAVLGFFHAISAQTTAWCFVAWLAVLVLYNIVSAEPTKPIEPDLMKPKRIIPSGFGSYVPNELYERGYVSTPPQGGDATIPVSREAYLDPTVKLMKLLEREIYMRDAIVSSSDVSYDEPHATYPEMEME